MVQMMLVDGVTGEEYILELDQETFERACNDMVFAHTLLQAHVKDLEKGAGTGNLEESVEEQAIPEEMDAENSTQQDKENFRWPDELIKLLIATYKADEHLLLSGKYSNKKFWERMASIIGEVTARQCASKWAGLKNTYKSVNKHNSKSGNDPRFWPFFDAMDEVLGKRCFMKPLSTLDTGTAEEPVACASTSGAESSPSSSTPKRRKTDNIDKTLKRLEQNAQDRKECHKENMERQDKLIELLGKLVEK